MSATASATAPPTVVTPTALPSFNTRIGILAASATVINALMQIVFTTSVASFFATAPIIVTCVFLEEHIPTNLYLSFRERHNTVKNLSLSSIESGVFLAATLAISISLSFGVVNIFSAPLVYRAIPLSWFQGIWIAGATILVDHLFTYGED